MFLARDPQGRPLRVQPWAIGGNGVAVWGEHGVEDFQDITRASLLDSVRNCYDFLPFTSSGFFTGFGEQEIVSRHHCTQEAGHKSDGRGQGPAFPVKGE